MAPVVERIFAGTVEFNRNGEVIARVIGCNGKDKVRSTGRWEVKGGQAIVTGLRFLGDDPFEHWRLAFNLPGWHTLTGNLIGTNRLELRPPLADLPPAVRRASWGFNLPLVRVTSAAPPAQPSEPDPR